MKKAIFSLAILAVIGTSVQAQDAKTKTKATGMTWGAKAQIGFGNIVGKDIEGKRLDNEMAIKWGIGVNAEFPIGKDFYFQPGLTFQTKGAKTEGKVGNLNYKSTVNPMYLDVPLTFLYKAPSGGGSVLLGFGPYVGFGIGGNVETELGSTETKGDIEYRGTYSAADDKAKKYMKRFDFGANVLAGYEFASRFSVGVNAQVGMVKTNSDFEPENPSDKRSERNIGFALNFGYRFGK